MRQSQMFPRRQAGSEAGEQTESVAMAPVAGPHVQRVQRVTHIHLFSAPDTRTFKTNTI